MKYLALFIASFLFASLKSQNLQSSAWVLTPASIDASSLSSPYTPGEILASPLNLQISEELSVHNVSNQVKWCIYAQLANTTTGSGTLEVSIGYNSPPVCIDPTKTNYTLEITSTASPFISGKGTLNKAVVSYAITGTALPQALSEQYQITYTIQTGSCPTL